MTPWLALLKKPKILAIGALSLAFAGYYAFSEVKQARLESRVSELESSIQSKDSQIRSLVSSVDTQNAEVQRWQEAAQTRQAAAQEAQRQAQAARREADERVGQIKAENAQTCQEGIELINRVEGLYESNL